MCVPYYKRRMASAAVFLEAPKEQMKVLHTTSSKSEADSLVRYLADVAIDAAVVGHFDPVFRMWSLFDVILRTGVDFDRAQDAVREFMASPAAMVEDLEHRSVADISSLDPALAPPCPSCRKALPLDGSLRHCPSCGTEVDVGALVVSLYGPEAFGPVACPYCENPATGLPRPERGPPTCPECGKPITPTRLA